MADRKRHEPKEIEDADAGRLVARNEPEADLDAYRRCLSQFATGVTVVTARSGSKLVAMTANSFSSVSLDPPLVSWSVKRDSQSFQAFSEAPGFVINILSSDQIALSRHFGKSGDDKFSGISWTPGVDGLPLLSGAAACIECRRVRDFDGGDHLVMLGQVVRFTHFDRNVLLFVQGKYGVVGEHPELLAGMGGAKDDFAAGPVNEFFAGLMYRAYGALAVGMTQAQHELGFDPVEGRLLGAIATFAGRTAETLLPELYLSTNATETGIASLRDQGLVDVAESGVLRLSDKGQERLKDLTQAIRLHESALLEGVAPADVERARGVMRRVIENSRRNKRLQDGAAAD